MSNTAIPFPIFKIHTTRSPERLDPVRQEQYTIGYDGVGGTPPADGLVQSIQNTLSGSGKVEDKFDDVGTALGNFRQSTAFIVKREDLQRGAAARGAVTAYYKALALTALPENPADYFAALTGRTAQTLWQAQTDTATWYMLWEQPGLPIAPPHRNRF